MEERREDKEEQGLIVESYSPRKIFSPIKKLEAFEPLPLSPSLMSFYPFCPNKHWNFINFIMYVYKRHWLYSLFCYSPLPPLPPLSSSPPPSWPTSMAVAVTIVAIAAFKALGFGSTFAFDPAFGKQRALFLPTLPAWPLVLPKLFTLFVPNLAHQSVAYQSLAQDHGRQSHYR